jgi:hypothetical protein
LRRAVDFGEHSGACASSAGDLVIRQQALAMATPGRVVENNKWLGQFGEK